MALIDCPECGHQVSDQAPSCPQCGMPIAASSARAQAVAPATAPAATPAEAASGVQPSSPPTDPTERYDIVLVQPGAHKIQVIKALRSVTDLGLAQAKRLVDGAPQRVAGGLGTLEADRVHTAMVDAGAEARAVPHDPGLLAASLRAAQPEQVEEWSAGTGALIGLVLVVAGFVFQRVFEPSGAMYWVRVGITTLGVLFLMGAFWKWWDEG